eukprot:TRINITY_DN31_c0_g1_i1.p1 TRINITY_DN31_c0_g1~~TRINITY_DN31_c0_g1_i1.p1  ORF type:complete len:203 (-),score=7.38 TRINITY_DN31_c0_g1_i1:126-734(-)
MNKFYANSLFRSLVVLFYLSLHFASTLQTSDQRSDSTAFPSSLQNNYTAWWSRNVFVESLTDAAQYPVCSEIVRSSAQLAIMQLGLDLAIQTVSASSSQALFLEMFLLRVPWGSSVGKFQLIANQGPVYSEMENVITAQPFASGTIGAIHYWSWRSFLDLRVPTVQLGYLDRIVLCAATTVPPPVSTKWKIAGTVNWELKFA